ncbi:MAG: YgiT-type zinc finger protein [Alicyclobacillus sp.]|nr:YgiT-type zinc finger protein [Alicyclobacillus sp.]
MVSLKAALWTNGDEEELLKRAAKAYQEDIPLADECCFECNTETKEVLADYEIPDGRHVVFEGVPTMICPNCGNREWDLNVLAALEQIAETLPANTRMKLTDVLQEV